MSDNQALPAITTRSVGVDRAYCHPIVTPVGAPAARTGRRGPAKRGARVSQRALVEASLLICPQPRR